MKANKNIIMFYAGLCTLLLTALYLTSVVFPSSDLRGTLVMVAIAVGFTLTALSLFDRLWGSL